MIDGVTILATDVVTMMNPIMTTILVIIGAIAIVGLLLFFIGFSTHHEEIGAIGLIIFFVTIAIFFISIPIDSMTQVPDYNTYEVILNDSVSMNEFMSTYKVLEQRGQIYVVKEIEK